MRRGQAQPLRHGSGRAQSSALKASQKGSPAFLRNPQDAKRKATRKKKRRSRGRYKTPLHAMLNVRSRY